MSDQSDSEEDDFVPEIIRPPNRALEKVTLGGKIKKGGMDPNLLKDARTRADGMQGTFAEALATEIGRLEEALKAAETEKSAEKVESQLTLVQQAAHGINGYGKTAGFDLLSRYGYSLSTFLRKADIATKPRLQVARVHVDAIRLVHSQGLTGDGGAVGTTLTKELRKAVNKYLADV